MRRYDVTFWDDDWAEIVECRASNVSEGWLAPIIDLFASAKEYYVAPWPYDPELTALFAEAHAITVTRRPNV